MIELTRTEARRIALAAQAFGPKPDRVDKRHLRRVISAISVLQIDPIDVVCRSHYLPAFARLGPYTRATLDAMCWGPRAELFEYWGHKASFLPHDLRPLYGWRMAFAESWDWRKWPWPPAPGWKDRLGAINAAPWAVVEGMMRLGVAQPGFVGDVLALVAEHGPVAARDLDDQLPPPPSKEGGAMWNWANVKIALEWLFFMGKLSVSSRRGFEGVYDLTERVIPGDVLASPIPEPDDAKLALVRLAARNLGVATEKQIRQYFGLRGADVKPAIRVLLDEGALRPVRVEGVKQRYLLAEGAEPLPDVDDVRALLTPFDSLIWDRDRTEALFDFHYRISLYTPEPQREHGYYVMPFLLGDSLPARVDLRMDREKAKLHVLGAFAEPNIDRRRVAGALHAELERLAGWLDLGSIDIRRNGTLATALSRVG